MPTAHPEVFRTSLRRKKRSRIGLTIFLSILIIVIGGGLIWAFYLPSFIISQVAVEGVQAVPTRDVSHIAIDDLAGNYWLLWPKRSIFLYPSKTIEHDVARAFPQFSHVQVGAGDGRLVIDVTERQPALEWCRGDATTANCYLSDQNGFIFSAATSSVPGSLPQIEALLPPQPIGRILLGTDQVKTLITFDKNLPALFAQLGFGQFTPGVIKADDVTAGDVTVMIESGASKPSSWKLNLTLKMSALDSLSNLEAVLTSDSFAADWKKKPALDYIDLRLGDKIFYRMGTGSTASSTYTQH